MGRRGLHLLALAALSPPSRPASPSESSCAEDEQQLAQGGWLGDAELQAALAALPCELAALDAAGDPATAAGWLAATADRPRLLRGLAAGWPATARWQRAALLRQHGETRVQRRRPVEVAQFGAGDGHAAAAQGADHLLTAPRARAGTLSLEAFVRGLRRPGGADPGGDAASAAAPYEQLFDRAAAAALRDDCDPPQSLSSLNDSVLSLGRSRTGLPYHTHGESALALLHGRKLWLLHPPGPAPAPVRLPPSAGEHGLGEWAEAVAASGAMVCVQEPGDMLVLPAAWHHATINVGETIGIAWQANRLLVSQSEAAAAYGEGSRQAILAEVEATHPSSVVELLRGLRRVEPANVDTVQRLVGALLAEPAAKGGKLGKKARKAAEMERKRAAVKEVHGAVAEVREAAWLGALDSEALRVRLCAMLTDLAQLKAAERCLAAVRRPPSALIMVFSVAESAPLQMEAPPGSESAQRALHLPRLHFELARVRMRRIESAMRQGTEVKRSEVEPIASNLRRALAIDPSHRAAKQYAALLAAPPPDGLGLAGCK